MTKTISKYFLRQLPVVCAVLLLSLHSFAQANVKGVAAPKTDINLKVYQRSLAIGDYGTAIHSVYYLIATDSAKYATWQDTLALLYLRSNALQQAFLLSDALLKKNGYTELRMNIKAVSAKGLQATVEAIDAYSVLFNKTANPGYGFEQLQLQYALRRLAETVETGNKLIQLIPAADSNWVNELKADGNGMQKVSLKASVYNTLGQAYAGLNKNDLAANEFEAALKEAPDFEQAKNNLIKTQTTAENKK